MTVNEADGFVPNGEDSEATARSLLEAAQAADLDPSVVRVAPGFGGYFVPASLAAPPDPPASEARKK